MKTGFIVAIIAGMALMIGMESYNVAKSHQLSKTLVPEKKETAGINYNNQTSPVIYRRDARQQAVVQQVGN